MSRIIFYYAECHYAKCHYAECHYAECRYVECCYAECRNDAYRGLYVGFFHLEEKTFCVFVYQCYKTLSTSTMVTVYKSLT